MALHLLPLFGSRDVARRIEFDRYPLGQASKRLVFSELKGSGITIEELSSNKHHDVVLNTAIPSIVT
jgi:hypothetical protein